MSIGSRLKEARKNKGLTQEALAALVNVSKGAIGNYESGVSSPKDSILIDLMRVLDVDANFLYQDLAPSSPDLTSDERLLLSAWRTADDSMKNAVRKLLDI